MNGNVFSLIFQAGIVVKLVMLALLFFSVVSWAIIIFKYVYLKRAERENELFYHAFRRTRDMEGIFSTSKKYLIGPISNVFRQVFMDTDQRGKAEVLRTIKRYEALERAKLEKHLGFLATTGASTPFVGLFGTVWGIMTSFMDIGQAGAASLAVVAPGIAEALIATAMGLVAAIPAVIAYNYYLSRANNLIIQMEDFSEDIQDFLTHGRGATQQ
jgi:biopolymer transport protein TolQ